ncbi:MAG: hypothetical protein K8U03_26260 [Planctomycetia bacterium]|nr:hypothetical protein [Planctomycetia bacterium]
MSVVLLSADLMCMSKVSSAAAQVGVPCTSAMSTAALEDKLVEGTRLVLLDLTTPGLTPSILVPKLRTSLKTRPRIVAFGPHVQGELLEEAETSGCDSVFTRGEFHAKLPQIISQFVAVAE